MLLFHLGNILAILFTKFASAVLEQFEGYDSQDSGTSSDGRSCRTLEHLRMAALVGQWNIFGWPLLLAHTLYCYQGTASNHTHRVIHLMKPGVGVP